MRVSCSTGFARRAVRSSVRPDAATARSGAITGMSPEMVTRYSRFADQKALARAAARRLEGRTGSEPGQ